MPPLLIGLALCLLLMAGVWLIASRLDNYGLVDIAWAGSIGGLAVLYAAMAATSFERRALVLVTAVGWSGRLTAYLYRRVMGLHPTEDTRYQDLRRSWGDRLRVRMFWFFQGQALAAVFFSLPFALILSTGESVLHWLEVTGALVWAIGVIGESIADAQLARFKADPAHRGELCDVGLWRYSRHPNYFFEWIVWCGFAVMALPAPWGPVALLCPLAMLWLLLRVTGIPATEAAAVARRGEQYREYQRTTSPFIPWFPNR